ncbi:hypothetical protein Hdeb2414_s0004g00133381 [Helianthus debilis subsp. tardiflorus]
MSSRNEPAMSAKILNKAGGSGLGESLVNMKSAAGQIRVNRVKSVKAGQQGQTETRVSQGGPSYVWVFISIMRDIQKEDTAKYALTFDKMLTGLLFYLHITGVMDML